MKIALLYLAIVASLIATSQANSRRWGNRASTDILLYRGRVTAPASEFLRTKAKFKFPGKKIYNPYTISEVRIVDNKIINGGFAKIKKGPGYKKVKLTFKSDRRQNLDYTVEIYGNPYSAMGQFPYNGVYLPNGFTPQGQLPINGAGIQGPSPFNAAGMQSQPLTNAAGMQSQPLSNAAGTQSQPLSNAAGTQSQPLSNAAVSEVTAVSQESAASEDAPVSEGAPASADAAEVEVAPETSEE